MFEFLTMMGTYESRKVARDDYPWGFISTAAVNDGSKPYETAVQHKSYGDGMVIVENYDTKTAAQDGHAKWVKTMTAKKLPAKLVDCNNAGIAAFGAALGMSFDKKRNTKKRKSA